jgi:hypothetical protein
MIASTSTLPSWENLFEDEDGDIDCDCGLGIRGHARLQGVVVDEVDEMEQRQRRGVNQTSDQPQHTREHNYARQPLGDRTAASNNNQYQQVFDEIPSCQDLNEDGDDEYDDPDYEPSRLYF